MASLPQPSDGMILEIGPRLERYLSRFSAIQTHPSRRFHLAKWRGFYCTEMPENGRFEYIAEVF
jgi:hypothetical protein